MSICHGPNCVIPAHFPPIACIKLDGKAQLLRRARAQAPPLVPCFRPSATFPGLNGPKGGDDGAAPGSGYSINPKHQPARVGQCETRSVAGCGGDILVARRSRYLLSCLDLGGARHVTHAVFLYHSNSARLSPIEPTVPLLSTQFTFSHPENKIKKVQGPP